MLISGVIAVVATIGICFLAITIYAAIQLVKLFWYSCKGIRYKFDPKTTPDNVLMAIEPIDEENNLKEYKYVLNRLITGKSKLIEEKTKLIGTYARIVEKMEKKDDKPKSGSV